MDPFSVLYFILCLVIGIAGNNRPLRFWGYFLSSILFTPLIGLLLLLAAGDNRARYDRRARYVVRDAPNR
jgi:hypothetical protein